ncbi:MAG: Tfp pilus assembly protein FimT/FimU [Gammaproteobacteria bacterium]|nr:MAG: Tfp pilus assembly protein FimT/FimU [Gammaproteobacteria bacterium]
MNRNGFLQASGACRARARAPCLSNCGGFTIMELLSTLSIAATISTLSFSVLGLVEKTRITVETNKLIASLHMARSESIKRGERVTVCQTPDGLDCGRSDRWEDGWIVFADPNNNRYVDPGEDVITVEPSMADSYSTRWRGSLGTNYYLSFLEDGHANKVGTFTICGPAGPEQARTVIIFRSGRVRTSDKKSDGKSLPDCPT